MSRIDSTQVTAGRFRLDSDGNDFIIKDEKTNTEVLRYDSGNGVWRVARDTPLQEMEANAINGTDLQSAVQDGLLQTQASESVAPLSLANLPVTDLGSGSLSSPQALKTSNGSLAGGALADSYYQESKPSPGKSGDLWWPKLPRTSLKWTTNVSGLLAGIYSGAVEYNGTVVVGDEDGVLYGVDAETGAQQWSNNIASNRIWSMARKGGTVVVGSFDNNAYAVSISDGTQEWSYTGATDDYVNAIIYNDTVILNNKDSTVYSLNMSDGTQAWTYSIGQPSSSGLTIENGTLVLGDDSGTLHGVDTSTGSGSWTNTVSSGNIIIGGGASSSGIAVHGANNDAVYAVNVSDGSQAWSYSTIDGLRAIVVDSGNFIMGDVDHDVASVAVSDGSENWVSSVTEDVEALVVVDDIVFVVAAGSFTTYIVGLQVSNGTLEYFNSLTEGSSIRSVASDNDSIYFGDEGGNVRAVLTKPYYDELYISDGSKWRPRL